MITPEQCRAARALLGMTQAQLADRSNVGLRSIQGFEAGKRSLEALALSAVTRLLTAEGILFERHDDWIGVKIRLSANPRSRAEDHCNSSG